jgi:quinol monooxygenase YgiN
MTQLMNLAFNWRSAEALDAHMRSTHLQAFLKIAPNLIAGDNDLRRVLMISTRA